MSQEELRLEPPVPSASNMTVGGYSYNMKTGEVLYGWRFGERNLPLVEIFKIYAAEKREREGRGEIVEPEQKTAPARLPVPYT
ncbi:hypothetical protein [Mycobacteroides abscessus]